MFKKLLIVLSLVFITGSASAGSNNAVVTVLRCEYLADPLGIDTPEPRFSWVIESSKRGFVQFAYEIHVASIKEKLTTNSGMVWNSEKVISRQSTNITYKGEALTNRTTYYWRVRVWDKEGNVTPWSKIATFHIGLLKQSDWTAKWIASADVKNRSPLLRKEIILKNNIKKALVYVSCIGNYDLYLNGKRVGDYVMESGPTQHERRVLYTTYDVTDYLVKGENAIGIWLGEGWGAFTVSDSSRFYQKAKAIGPFDRPKAIIQLDVVYSSGENERIITDESWKTLTSPLTYNNFFGGEDYDARLEQPGWSKSNFNDSEWEPALIQNVNVQLSAQMLPPMKVMQVLQPIKQTHPQKNIFVYDFGQVFGGWFRVYVKGKKGSKIRIRGSETLGNNKFAQPLTEDLTLNFSRSCFRGCESNYILKGDGVEVYEPRFYYNGFRYLQIETDQPETLDSLKAEGCAVYTALNETATFECSEKILNQIHQMTVRTFKTILQGLPGGNTNDEKYAWTGDAHLFYEAANQNFDMAAFWTKWLTDVADAQSMFKSGVVPNVAPYYHKTLNGEPLRAATASWGAAYPIVAWASYLYYNDERILAEHYEGIKRYCDYLISTSKGHLVEGVIGDHNAPGISEGGEHLSRGKILETANLVASAYYFRSIQIMSKIADVLSKRDESQKYAIFSEKIKLAYNNKFFDQEKKIYREGKPEPGFFPLQAVNLIPLQMGLVPEEYRKVVLDHVINDISETHNNHLLTGIMGTKAMVDVLPDYNYSELLYKVATQNTFPGWGYMLENGATTLWQHWTGHKGDLAHAMWSTIDEFFIEDLAGIKSPAKGETTIGYENIVIKPSVVEKMNFAKASTKCIKGRITSDWKKERDRFTLKVVIPANSTASVYIPRFSCSDYIIKESDQLVWEKDQFKPKVEGIYWGEKKGNYVEFTVGSGKYHFTVDRE